MCGAALGAHDQTLTSEPLPRIPVSPRPEDERPERRLAWVAGGAALVISVAIVGVLWWALAGRDGTAAAAVTTSSSTGAVTTTTTPAPTPSTVTVTSTPPQTVTTTVTSSATETTSDGVSESEAQDFFDWYYSTAPVDPSSTWESLSPGIQSVGTGYSSYTEWWESIASAQGSVLAVDGETVRVSVHYVHTSGKTRDETYTYVLRRDEFGSLQLADKNGQ